MAAQPTVRGVGAGGRIEVVGLSKFRKELKQAIPDADKQMKEANNKVANLVIRGARALADTKQEKRAAQTLFASSSGLAARVTGGGKGVAYFGGANFGAYTNQRRVIKMADPRTGRRGRSTLVRKYERTSKVVGRIEAQYSPRTGENVKVKRTSTGKAKVIRGWNQFGAARAPRTKWQKGKDQFLYAAVRVLAPTISKQYEDALRNFTHEAFD